MRAAACNAATTHIRVLFVKARIPRRRHRHRLADTPTSLRPIREDPHEDVDEDVGVRVGVGVVECELKLPSRHDTTTNSHDHRRVS